MPASYDYYKDFCICPLRQISLVMHTTADLEPSAYPVNVYNVNLVNLGLANTKQDYINLWNTDNSNRAKGTLVGNYGPFSFVLIANNGQTPPPYVYGNPTGTILNQGPSAQAGADITVTYPTSTARLVGSGSDPDGSIVSYLWIKESGPAGETILTPTSSTTDIIDLAEGTYIFRLTVTDNSAATGSDTVKVTVLPGTVSNFSPTANAGFDVIVNLPTSSVSLTGSGSDIDGFVASYAWSKTSGPAGETITSPSSANTTVTGLVQGTYIFRLTVTDNLGATGFDEMQVLVNAAPPTGTAPSITTQPTNQTLTEGQTLTLTVVASGSAPLSYQWRRNGANISGATSATFTKTSVLADAGSYDVIVSNAYGSIASNVVTVTVNPVGASGIFTTPFTNQFV